MAISGHGWALGHARGTSNPLGHSAGRCGVRGGARGGGRGSAQQSSPACGAPAATEGYGLRNYMQKVRGKRVGAHRGSNRAEASDRVVATKLSGGARSESGKELAVRVALDSSGLLGGTNGNQAVLQSRERGQGGLKIIGGEESSRRAGAHLRWCRCDSGGVATSGRRSGFR